MGRQKKPPERDDILRQLAKMAFGKANDCVELALRGENAELKKLDLSLLAGIKRCKDGSVEVQLVDRMQALKELAALTDCQDGDDPLLLALCGGKK